MSAFAALTLVDSAAANVTFNPQSIDAQGVATYMTNESVFDAKRKVTMSVALAKNGSNVNRIKQRIMIPIMDTVDTTKQVAVAYADIQLVLPKQATSVHRLDLRKFAETLLSNAVTTAGVTNLEAIY